MSVITYLEKRASNAVLSEIEKISINRSIDTIKSRLDSYFGTELKEHFRFGSSTRGTILPRSMDGKSDIDYMIVFKDDGYTPQTYLDRIKRFADIYYSSSEIKQSSPSIVLQLNHIRFDLVPALSNWYQGYRIPNGGSAWRDTNPNDFNAQLTVKNNAELSMIKPTIRLVKFWNAQGGFIYDSYGLEKYIVELGFFNCGNQKDYLFKVIDSLNSYTEVQWKKEEIERAKKIIAQVRAYESGGMPYSAENEVKKLIPD
ncbi:SMODS domain-containing nucleotidyltransferase [Nitrosospira briensis]|uniref:SMODS domain-containing nucleotidyltransferase n=1 Tax=Nitrosospira briensis TaxID=35799 RepID=UPI0008EF6027|nr:nucleotidyltransferase [Nitrosospira briensis]SFO14060.1 hypothetical protein SAMN05216332_1062 [Nitrosospira briensis]